MRLEMKSALIGAALALFVGAALGAGVVQRAEAGRFAIATNQGHVFVLDTATGQTWEKFEPATEGGSDQDFADPKLGTPKNH